MLNSDWSIEKGMIKLSTYLILYRVGDIVDIKANAAQQKGMPHKYYHGYVCVRISEHGISQTTLLAI